MDKGNFRREDSQTGQGASKGVVSGGDINFLNAEKKSPKEKVSSQRLCFLRQAPLVLNK